MSKKRYRPEEIISKLREVDILVGQGKTVAQSIKAIGVSEVTYYRWRQEYGAGAGEIEGAEQIVGKARGGFGKKIGGRRSHAQ